MRRIVVLAVGLLVLGQVPALAMGLLAAQATPAQAAPYVQRPAACWEVQQVQPGEARAHLELTDVGDRIRVRFVLHQMTTPGHRWRIVFRHGQDQGCCEPFGHGDGRVFFVGIRLATGNSGDITVQQSVMDYLEGDHLVAKARDRQTGQFCHVHIRIE